MPKKKQFEIGEVYGNLKILSYRYKGTSLYYKVECQDCGGVYEAQGPGVRNGCKLCRTERKRKERREGHEKLIGQQFGDLIVTGVEDKLYGPSTAYRVEYECTKCGYKGAILPYKLTEGITTMCPKCAKKIASRTGGAHTKGIAYIKSNGQYRATATISVSAGIYKTLEEAIQARDETEERLRELWKAEKKARRDK